MLERSANEFAWFGAPSTLPGSQLCPPRHVIIGAAVGVHLASHGRGRSTNLSSNRAHRLSRANPKQNLFSIINGQSSSSRCPPFGDAFTRQLLSKHDAERRIVATDLTRNLPLTKTLPVKSKRE